MIDGACAIAVLPLQLMSWYIQQGGIVKMRHAS